MTHGVLSAKAAAAASLLALLAGPDTAQAQSKASSIAARPLEGAPRGRAVACVVSNAPPKMPVGGTTPSPGGGLPVLPGAARVQVVFEDSPLVFASLTPWCATDADCAAGSYCAGRACRAPEDVPQGPRIRWTSSEPTVVRVSQQAGRRGQMTGLRAGTSLLSATYSGDDGPLACGAGASSPSAAPVNVVPRLLCDLIVTTRPWRPDAHPEILDRSAGNRLGASLGIDDGDVSAHPDGLALRRAYFPHAGEPPGGPGFLPGSDSRLGNDPRVLLPRISGVKQLFRAVGLFAEGGDAVNCSAAPSGDRLPLYAFDVSQEAAWDVTEAADPNTPLPTATARTSDAALNVLGGVASVVDRGPGSWLQAVRATVTGGPRFCTGSGAPVGPRDASQPCRHALVFEVCGAPDTDAGAVVLSPWARPIFPNRSPFGPGRPNPPLEATAPAIQREDFYSVPAGDSRSRYYALQRMVGFPNGCRLTQAIFYRLDVSNEAWWSSTNPGIASVELPYRLRSLAAGTTSVMTIVPWTRLGSSLDFRVSQFNVP